MENETEKVETTETVLELSPDPVKSVEEAQAAAAEALVQVKAIEVNALAEVTKVVTVMMQEMTSLLTTIRETLAEVEELKFEALDLVDALQDLPATESETNETPDEEPHIIPGPEAEIITHNEAPKTSKLKAHLKAVIAGTKTP